MPPLIIHIHRPEQKEPAPREETTAHAASVSFNVPSHPAASSEQPHPLLPLGESFSHLGRADYAGTSVSVTNIGPTNLDVVASFMSEDDLRNFVAAEPGVGAGPLTSAIIQAETRIHEAEGDRAEAQNQIDAAERVLRRTQSTCRDTRKSLALGATGAGVGGLLALVGSVGGGGDLALRMAGASFAGSAAAFLYVGGRLIRASTQQRTANQALTDGQSTRAAARDEEASQRENLSVLMNRLRGVDVPNGS